MELNNVISDHTNYHQIKLLAIVKPHLCRVKVKPIDMQSSKYLQGGIRKIYKTKACIFGLTGEYKRQRFINDVC